MHEHEPVPAERVEPERMRLRDRITYSWDHARGRPVVHMLHIGKTGGVAIKAATRKYLRSGTYAIYKHSHRWKLRHIPEGEKFFFFIRHPIPRFVSAFVHQQLHCQPRFYLPWEPEEAVAFSRFSSANELALALSSNDPTRRDEAVHAMRNIPHVRESFYDWFESDEKFLRRRQDILFIGFQENMASDFEELKRIIGLPKAVSLPADETKSNKNPANSNTFLDKEARANLSAWYARDIQFYELCKSVREQTNAGVVTSALAAAG